MSVIHLPSLFQDYMILQRDKPIHIWGSIENVEVLSISLGEIVIQTNVSDDHFHCLFPAQSAGRGLTLSFFAGMSTTPDALLLTIQDVSIGDIFMAGGQSNMEYFLRYDANWQDTKRLPRNSDIHMFNVPQIAYEGQVKHLPSSGFWFGEGDAAWAEFSAPGYAFARHLQEDLQVPIGIIGCNWGGTPACAWMDEAHLKDPELSVFNREYEAELARWDPEELKEKSLAGIAFEDSYRHQIEWRAMVYGLTWEEQVEWMRQHEGEPEIPMGPYHHYRPSGLYHTMLETIAPFSIKGFLWYQGESDSAHAVLYRKTFSSLIDCFRKTWQDEDLPFLFVQLAPFARWLACTGDHYTEVRESQEYVAKHIPKAYMASIMDLGMHDDIHPKHKMEVGRRLALLARGYVYGEDILCDAPAPAAVTRNEKEVRIRFAHAGDGLTDDGMGTSAFVCTQNASILTIRGHQIHGDEMVLLFDHLDADIPVQIDFARQDFCEVHLWNSAGLSAKPFSLRV